MKKSDRNLSVIQNFILHLTHCSKPEDGDDPNYKVPMTFTPEIMYELAKAYIEEDHVDGRDNPDDNIVEFGAESSFQTEDREQEYPEFVAVVADFGPEGGTETVASLNMTNVQEVQELLKVIKEYGN